MFTNKHGKNFITFILVLSLFATLGTVAFADGVQCSGISGLECEASSHIDGCDKFVAAVICPGISGLYCEAATHVAGCDYYVGSPSPSVCEGTSGVECSADSHIEGCDKFVPAGAPKLKLVPKAIPAPKVCKIGDAEFETIQAAVEASQPGDTIVITTDIVMDISKGVTNSGGYYAMVNVHNRSVIIDLNGKSISVNASGLTESMLLAVFATDENGSLTLKDSAGGASVSATAGGKTIYSLITCYEPTGSITINGGSYSVDEASDSLLYCDGDEIVTVNGGSFNLGNIGTGANGMPWIFNAKGQNTRNIIVNGGTFNADFVHQYYPFEVMVPNSRALRNNGDGTWTIVDAVAYVNEQEWSSAWYTNEVGYATLEEALAAAEDQKTKNGKVSDAEFITLFGNAKLSRSIENPDYPIEVPKEAGIELDGNKINGVELIKGSKIRLTDSKGSGAAKLTLEDGSENEYKVPVGYTLTVYSDGRTELTRNPVPGNPNPNSNSSNNSVNNPYGIPSTGDNSNVALWSVLFLGFAGLALVSGKKRRS